MIQGCREGDAEAWRALVAQYTPVLAGVAKAYSSDPGRIAGAWRGVLGSLAGHDFAALKEVEAQSDREFFSVLRASLLEQFTAGPEDLTSPDGLDTITVLEDLSRLMRESPLVHQNMMFLHLTGYSDPDIELILRISPAVAQRSVERLNAAFWADFRRSMEAAHWQAAWLRMNRRMRRSKTPDCVPIRPLIRILDGQFGWYEKDPIERHLGACLHCLEAWVGLQEITHWMQRGTPLTPAQVDELLSGLPVKAKSQGRFSLLKRAFR